jgi:hypothetical protein
LAGLQNLTLLDLINTEITAAAVGEIVAMKSLQEAYLRATRVTAAGIWAPANDAA